MKLLWSKKYFLCNLKHSGKVLFFGTRVLKILQGSFAESIIKIQHRDGVRSRLHLSSKSLCGVLEFKDILDLAEDGARVLKILQGSFTESITKIQHQEACQDSIYPPSLFLESRRTGMFLI